MNAVPSEAPSGKKNAVNLFHRIFCRRGGIYSANSTCSCAISS